MYAFIHVRKTAGSTVAAILRQSFLTRHCDVRIGHDRLNPVLTSEVLRRIGWVYPRLLSVQGHGVVPFSDLTRTWPQMRFYTFLRDPLTRCASEYQYQVQRGGFQLPFDEWITTDAARNRMTKKLCGVESAEAAISMIDQRIGLVGLVGRFDESLVLFRRWLDDSRLDIRYRAKNVTRDNTLKHKLLEGQQTRKQLILANLEDLKLYEHVVHRVYPRQVIEYGSSLNRDLQAFQTTNRRPAMYPRQLGSLLVREFVYRPLAPRLAGHGTRFPEPERMKRAA